MGTSHESNLKDFHDFGRKRGNDEKESIYRKCVFWKR